MALGCGPSKSPKGLLCGVSIFQPASWHGQTRDMRSIAYEYKDGVCASSLVAVQGMKADIQLLRRRSTMTFPSIKAVLYYEHPLWLRCIPRDPARNKRTFTRISFDVSSRHMTIQLIVKLASLSCRLSGILSLKKPTLYFMVATVRCCLFKLSTFFDLSRK